MMNRIDNVVEDRPLSGPWSRRPVEVPPKRNDYTDQEAGAGYGSRDENDDQPLSGPWSRRPAETPQERNDSPGGGEESVYRSSSDDEDIPGPKESGPEREVPTLRREVPENNSKDQGYSFRLKKKDPEAAGTEQQAVPQCPREAAGEERPDRSHPGPGHPEALLKRLFCPSGIYGGIVMAEVLGSRGGRSRGQHRRY